MSLSTSLISSLRLGAVAVLAAVSIPVFAGEPAAQPEPAELSPPISTRLSKFNDYQSASDWVSALKLVNELLASPQATNYDKFFLNNIKWQVILQDEKGSHADAFQALEVSRDLADRFGFADQGEMERILQTGSQLAYELGGQKKGPEKLALWEKATDYIKRYIEGARNPNVQNINFYAAILNTRYSDPETPKGPARDKLLEDSVKAAETGLRFWPSSPNETLAPKEDFYIIILSAYISQERYDKAAEIIELLLKINPKREEMWDRLASIYVSLAFNEKDKKRAFELNMRALNAYERAQQHGYLKSARYNELISSIYSNLGFYGLAAERMERDIKSGGLNADDEEKWDNVAAYYQLDKKFEKAIAILKEASAKFPNSGKLDFQAALAYNSLGDAKNAYEMSVRAGTKGFGEKTWRAWSLAAYSAYDLQEFEKGIEAINKALQDPAASQEDKQLVNLKAAFEASIQSRKASMESINAVLGK